MDFTAFVNPLQISLGAEIPRVLGSVAIMVLGWLLAVVCRAALRKTLGLTLGAVAVAVAIAFGLGGREAAG